MPLQSPKLESVRPSWPDWTGKTVVCIATGPSLTAEQIEHVYGSRMRDECRVIAINEAGLHRYLPLAAPWADMLYAADKTWWSHYKPSFMGYRISGEPVNDVLTTPLRMLERQEPMPREPGTVISGGHSGFQALGLSLTLGAARVLLLGYDCGGGPARNCHKDRPDKFKRDVDMGAWTENYRRVRKEWPDVEVLNCAQYSRIDCYEKHDIEDVL